MTLHSRDAVRLSTHPLGRIVLRDDRRFSQLTSSFQLSEQCVDGKDVTTDAIGNEVPTPPHTRLARVPFRRVAGLLAGKLGKKPALLSGNGRKDTELTLALAGRNLPILCHAQNTQSSIHSERNKQGQVDRARSRRSPDHHRHWQSEDGDGLPHALHAAASRDRGSARGSGSHDRSKQEPVLARRCICGYANSVGSTGSKQIRTNRAPAHGVSG